MKEEERREVFREGGELVVGESEGCVYGQVEWGSAEMNSKSLWNGDNVVLTNSKSGRSKQISFCYLNPKRITYVV